MSVTGWNEPPRSADRSRSRAPWVIFGVLSLLLVITFFWWFDQRDDTTLREGERSTGTIVGFVQPHDWDPFDSGRLVVRYDLDGTERVSRIWVDEGLDGYRVGQPVQVFVRGSHVRTDREPNDPAPLGSAAILLGLVGVGALTTIPALFALFGRGSDPYPNRIVA